MAIVKIRSPFFATERGIATRTTRTLPQPERRKRCASTMLQTTNIRLERMLLHSLATSTVKPGMVSKTPSFATGTPTAANSTCAVKADPCCKRLTISFKTACGNGTSQNRKQRGKSNDRETREPEQRMKAPIHDSTSENTMMESGVWKVRKHDNPLKKRKTKPAIASKRHPIRTLGANIGLRDRHSKKIRVALIGKIRSTCVYSSSRSASAKVLTRGRHSTNKKTTHRRAKLRCDANLVTDFSYFNAR